MAASFTEWEKLSIRMLHIKSQVELAYLKLRFGHRVRFGEGCRISSANFHLSGMGRLEIGAGVCIDRGLHPVSFDVGANAKVVIGACTWIQPNVAPVRFTAREGAEIEIGEGCWFSGGLFGATQKVTVGSRTLIGWGCNIMDSTMHYMDNETPPRAAAISIGSYVWMPTNIMVWPGVTIGDHCVIGSGSLVTEDIPRNSFAAGRPAKVIRKIADRDKAP